MKTYGGVDAGIHIFLTSALFGGEWPVSRSGRFTPGKKPLVPIGQEGVSKLPGDGMTFDVAEHKLLSSRICVGTVKE
jgi:hypothetical protein